jgi:hypothetical protein
MKKYILALILVIFCQVAQADQKKFNVRLNVPPVFDKYEVEGKSYLNRELREINDVEIVDVEGDWDYFISVVFAPLTVGETPSGIAVSYVFLHEGTIMHNVTIGSTSNLKGLCQKVIAHFDSLILEPSRK